MHRSSEDPAKWACLWNQDTDGRRGQGVKEYHRPEDSVNGLGEVAAGIFGLTSGDAYPLYSIVR